MPLRKGTRVLETEKKEHGKTAIEKSLREDHYCLKSVLLSVHQGTSKMVMWMSTAAIADWTISMWLGK